MVGKEGISNFRETVLQFKVKRVLGIKNLRTKSSLASMRS